MLWLALTLAQSEATGGAEVSGSDELPVSLTSPLQLHRRRSQRADTFIRYEPRSIKQQQQPISEGHTVPAIFRTAHLTVLYSRVEDCGTGPAVSTLGKPLPRNYTLGRSLYGSERGNQ